MNSLTKLVMASAVVVAFAAPALAYDYNSEGFPLQTRNENLVQQPASAGWAAGTDAYAMERSMDRGVWMDNSAGAERGAATINGGR